MISIYEWLGEWGSDSVGNQPNLADVGTTG